MPPFGMCATMALDSAAHGSPADSNPIAKGSHRSQRSCEKINNLIPRGGTKAQRLAKNNCFVFFAPSATLSCLAGRNAFGRPGIISQLQNDVCATRRLVSVWVTIRTLSYPCGDESQMNRMGHYATMKAALT